MTNASHASGRKKGFTLIELLIVIGIIGFLAAAVLVAVDPVKRIQDGRDARRSAEANAILNAILNKQVDDRDLYDGCCDTGGAPVVTQAGANVQVIVTNDAGIVCNNQATRPGCNKAMDTTGANKNCVVNVSTTFGATGTATSAGTAVTGTGTTFTTQVEVGDTLTSASGGTCLVTVVTDNTNITCSIAPAPAMAGTFTVTSADDTSIVPTYLAEVPIDPRGSGTATVCGTGSGCTTLGDLAIGASNTGYYLARTTGNRIEIGSCRPEQAATISVKR